MKYNMHLALHINQTRAQALNNKEICYRWHRNYKGTLLTRKYDNNEPMPNELPFNLTEYLKRIDWAGRTNHPKKHYWVESTLLTILQRLNITTAEWLVLITLFEKRGATLVGPEWLARDTAVKLGYKKLPGIRAARQLFA